MEMDKALFLLPYIVAAVLSIMLFLQAFEKRGLPVAWFFSLICLLQVVYASAFIFETIAVDPEHKIFWDNVQFIPTFFIPVFYYLFVLGLTGANVVIKKSQLVLFLFIPVLFMLIVFTDPLHRLIRPSYQVVSNGFFSVLEYPFTPTSMLMFLSSYVFMFAAIIQLVKKIIRPGSLRRSQLITVLLAYLVPLAGTFLVFTDFRLFGFRDITPLTLTLTTLILLFGVVRFRFLDIIPIAHESLVQNMPDAVFVFDSQLRLLDYNLAAGSLTAKDPKTLLGLKAAEIFTGQDRVLARITGPDNGQGEVSFQGRDKDRERFFQLTVTSITDHKGTMTGRIVLFRDITRLKRTEVMLQKARIDAEVQVMERTRDLKQEIESRVKAEEDLISLNRELRRTQNEIMITLSEVVETRSKETAHHVVRVAELSALLARKAGLPESLVLLIKDAAPMHDIGKIGIPDNILYKPSRLSSEEREVMKKHTTIGYDILKGSDREVMRKAATIALEHHERWDGSGYPRGLKGELVSVEARIVGIADVFDALYNPRFYKKAWDMAEIKEFFAHENGRQFETPLVEILFSSIDEVVAIMEQYPDNRGL